MVERDHDGGARFEVASQPRFAEQDAAHLGGVDHQQQHGIERLGQGAWHRP